MSSFLPISGSCFAKFGQHPSGQLGDSGQKSPGGPAKMQILAPQVQCGAQESALSGISPRTQSAPLSVLKCQPRQTSASVLSCQNHGQRPGVTATTPAPGLFARLTVDCRVFAVIIVSYNRFGHSAPHGRPWPGHRVAAQVHHVGWDPRPIPSPLSPGHPEPRNRGPGQAA